MRCDPGSVFDYLDETHTRMAEALRQLREVVQALQHEALDARLRQQARAVGVFFSGEARQHHLDEEKHIFPALRQHADEAVRHAERSLTQDHGWLEENWRAIAPMLEAAAEGNHWFDVVELAAAVDVYEALYRDHMALEESLAYPAARHALAALDTSGMGREMARRRALAAVAAS